MGCDGQTSEEPGGLGQDLGERILNLLQCFFLPLIFCFKINLIRLDFHSLAQT